jgi:hypothetical protein
MNNNNVKLAHPVLGSDDDVAGEIRYLSAKVIQKGDQFQLNVSCTFRNQPLEDLLRVGDVKYACQISCPTTLYLDKAYNSNGNFEILINKCDVSYEVHCHFYLIATRDLDYFNQEAHSDYENRTIRLKKGSVLGQYSEVISFDSEITQEDLMNPAKLFKIVRNSNVKLPTYVFDDRKIQLLLPEMNYDIYNNPKIADNVYLKPVFDSSFLLPMLTKAIYKIKESEAQENDDEHQLDPMLWERIIKALLNSKPEIEALNEDDENYPFLCAQIILGNPYNTMCNKLHDFVNR